MPATRIRNIKEFTQQSWLQADINLYRSPGDFDELYALYPDVTRRQLQRGPAWSGHRAFGTGGGGTEHLKNVHSIFWDPDGGYLVAVGTFYDGANSYIGSAVCSPTDFAWSAPYTLVTATDALGGRDGHNCIWWGGDLYVIGADDYVYRGSSYTGALTAFYSTANADILCPSGDRMYMITEAGDIKRLNAIDSAFEAHYTNVGYLKMLHASPFRNQLVIIGRQDDGTIHVYQVPDRAIAQPGSMQEITRLPSETADLPSYGSCITIYDDELYLTPGAYKMEGSVKSYDIYRFNGHNLKRIARIPTSSWSPTAAGFLNWRGELVFYVVSVSGGSATFDIYTLLGDRFVKFAPLANSNISGNHNALFSAAGYLIATGMGASEQGTHNHAGFQDGYLVTSRLDMGSPARLKRLERIVVLLDGAAANYSTIIKYRTDDNTSYTTAATQTNTRRAVADAIGAEFYTLQIRIDLDDDTGLNQDIRIDGLSVLYSEADA
jgi:hypothetical protein